MSAVRKEIEENLHAIRQGARQAAADMNLAGSRVDAINERLDQHIQRLDDGEDEVTPPPMPLPLAR